jgi:hypothetical protein
VRSSRSAHPPKPKTRRLEVAGWRPVSAGPKPRALVLVLHFCTAYPHFHGNGSAMNREHSPHPSPAGGCVFASMPAFSLALALRVATSASISLAGSCRSGHRRSRQAGSGVGLLRDQVSSLAPDLPAMTSIAARAIFLTTAKSSNKSPVAETIASPT